MTPSPLYTSSVYAAMGSCEHALLGFAEGFGLQFLKGVDLAVHGRDDAVRSFARSVLNCPPPQRETAFSFSIEEEAEIIKTLEKEGVLHLKSGWKETAAATAEAALHVLFAAITAPLSLPCAITALSLRAAVQNHRNEIACMPQRTPKIWDGASPLKIMTLNAAMTEFAIMDWLNGVPPTAPRVSELANWLMREDPDIFVLQEAFDADTIWPDLIRRLQKMGYGAAITGKREGVFGMTGGLVVATRYAIQDLAFHEYSHREGVDALTRKGVLAAKIRLREGAVICIGCTHMQAGYTQDKVSGTREQFQEGKQFLLDFGKGARDLFFVGDYNCGRFAAGTEPNCAKTKLEYPGMVEGLLHSEPRFKDLTVPNVHDNFNQSYSSEARFNPHKACNQETGESKGSVFNTSAPSYHFLKELIYLKAKKEGSIQEGLLKDYIDRRLSKLPIPDDKWAAIIDSAIDKSLSRAYRKPSVCDHISLRESKENLFSEVDYGYAFHIPVGEGGILSDHGAVIATLRPTK